MLQGAPLAIVLDVVTASIGIFMVGIATEGYFNAPINWISRLLIGAAGVCFVAPSMLLAAIGTILALIGFAPTLYPRFVVKRYGSALEKRTDFEKN